MCKFFSFFGFPSGDIRHRSDITDSHDLQARIMGLKDDREPEIARFCKCEFTPPSDTSLIRDLDKWTLVIDEPRRPLWADEAWETKILKAARAEVESFFVSDERDVLTGGSWILVGDAKIYTVVSCRIIAMRGNSQVREMRGNSQVREMRENSQVGVMWGNSRVEVMRENSQVGVMRGDSRVEVMRENSQVREMRGDSQVGVMWGNSQVGVMCENSRIVNDYRQPKT